jgi:hypothetical protein
MEPIDLRKGQPQSQPYPQAQVGRQPAPESRIMNLESRMGWWHRMTGEPMKTHEKVVGSILLIIFLFAFYVVLDANKYEATVHVISGEGRVGVNPTTERLDFGDLSPGTAAVRRVTIQNGTPIPMYVAVFRIGRINELMELDQNFFVMPKGAEEQLEFTVYMPASATDGDTLGGRVYIFKIPGPWRS